MRDCWRWRSGPGYRFGSAVWKSAVRSDRTRRVQSAAPRGTRRVRSPSDRQMPATQTEKCPRSAASEAAFGGGQANARGLSRPDRWAPKPSWRSWPVSWSAPTPAWPTLDGTMALRWCAAGMVEAGKQFRRSTTTYIYRHCHLQALRTALERHVTAKMPEPASTITLAIQPDAHRAAAENLRSPGHPPRLAHAEQGQEPELGEAQYVTHLSRLR